MPNWCYNRVYVYGEEESMNDFVTSITHTVTDDEGKSVTDHDLSLLFPIPEELRIDDVWFSSDNATPEHLVLLEKYEANMAKYGYKTWYDWCVANWGTKWSPNIHSIGHDGNRLTILCDSAWSPPTGLLTKASKEYPSLVFVDTYSEEGMEFWGCDVFRAGEIIAEHGYDSYHLPEPYATQHRLAAEKMEDEFEDGYESLCEIGNRVVQFCEDNALRTLRYAGIVPFEK